MAQRARTEPIGDWSDLSPEAAEQLAAAYAAAYRAPQGDAPQSATTDM